MKLKRVYFISLTFILVALGCDDDDSKKGSLKDLSKSAQQFVTMRLGSINTSNRSAESLVNQSFQSMIQGLDIPSGGDSTGSGTGDTTIYPDPWPWVRCAEFTQIQHDDGSVTSITDYGDGCEEGGVETKYWMHGKMTQTYKYTSSQNGSVITYTYLYQSLYENYGGKYYGDSSEWSIDGNSNYSGYSVYDTASHKFSGAYNHTDTSLYSFGSATQAYKSKGHSEYSETGWIVESNDYAYGDGDNYYRAVVTRPLVSDYTCNTGRNSMVMDAPAYIWMYVSGHEVISYRQDGKEGTFEIDYGDGGCDDIIYIIEDGKRIEVNMGYVFPVLYSAE